MKNLFVKMLLLDKKDEVPPGDQKLPEKKDEKPPEKKDEKPPETPPEKPEDFYKKDEKPPEKKDEKPPEKKEDVKPATGYGAEALKDDEAPPPDKKDEKPPEKKEEPSEIEKKLEGLSDGFKKIVKKQLEDLGLEKPELVDKFIEQKKQEQADADEFRKQYEAEMRRKEKEKFKAWDKELREDKDFGGEKFPQNLTRSEKILDEYLPELKKELTDSKQMLRPSVMRGLARLADALYPDRHSMQGDPPGTETAKDDKDKPNDPLAFYQQ